MSLQLVSAGSGLPLCGAVLCLEQCAHSREHSQTTPWEAEERILLRARVRPPSWDGLSSLETQGADFSELFLAVLFDPEGKI